MSSYKIIATVSEEELKKIQTYNLNPVDILEIRLDLITEEYFKTKLTFTLKQITKPFLFTYRFPEDSSLSFSSNLDLKSINNFLQEFNSKKNYLDVDLKFYSKIFPDYKNFEFTKIYSLHNFFGVYSQEDMQTIIIQVSDPNGIYKFAVLPQSFEDGINFLQAVKELSKAYTLIGIWMGQEGQFSRIFGDLYGSSFTYGTLETPKAPGQLNVNYIFGLRTIAKI
jgi:3-dehydroquinate dehydratase-1